MILDLMKHLLLITLKNVVYLIFLIILGILLYSFIVWDSPIDTIKLVYGTLLRHLWIVRLGIIVVIPAFVIDDICACHNFSRRLEWKTIAKDFVNYVKCNKIL